MTQPDTPDATGPDASDSLIPRDFNGWTISVWAVLSRSGARMAAVLALWSVIPVAGAVVSSAMTVDLLTELERRLPANSTGQPTAAETQALFDSLGLIGGVVGLTLAVSMVFAYFTSAGWAAALRIAVTDAVGSPLSLREAMVFGARRGLTMWGWYLLVVVCVLVGLCLCILPGIYLMVVFALFAPVVVFEGGPALARSLRLVHRAFGAMLGRILLLFAVILAFTLVLWQIQGIFGLGIATSADLSAANLVAEGVVSLISNVAIGVVLSAGLLVTYMESRAGEGTLTRTAQLLER